MAIRAPDGAKNLSGIIYSYKSSVLDIDHHEDVVLEHEVHDVLTTLLSRISIMFYMLSLSKKLVMF